MANKTISEITNERLSPNGDDFLLADSQSESLSYKIKVSKLLDRTNHTGAQLISTIAGLQTALNGKEPVIPLGTTSQYLSGDKTWQNLNKSVVGLNNVDNTSDLNKPISTATQTALNLKANLASPTFTGNLTLPNNTRINGVEHFYQSSKPTLRRDGTALALGDRWWDIVNGDEWYWNGTFWVSRLERLLCPANIVISNTGQEQGRITIPFSDNNKYILIRRFAFSTRQENHPWFVEGSFNWIIFPTYVTDGINMRFFTGNPQISFASISAPQYDTGGLYSTYRGFVNINQVLNSNLSIDSQNNSRILQFNITKVGLPPAININAHYEIQYIHSL